MQRKIAKILAIASYLMVLVAVATCQIGTYHEEQKIPAGVRSQMADTD